ncbi:MAG: hypothetical protein AAFO79_00305 [Pseudomonadota bacterium]
MTDDQEWCAARAMRSRFNGQHKVAEAFEVAASTADKASLFRLLVTASADTARLIRSK